MNNITLSDLIVEVPYLDFDAAYLVFNNALTVTSQIVIDIVLP